VSTSLLAVEYEFPSYDDAVPSGFHYAARAVTPAPALSSAPAVTVSPVVPGSPGPSSRQLRKRRRDPDSEEETAGTVSVKARAPSSTVLSKPPAAPALSTLRGPKVNLAEVVLTTKPKVNTRAVAAPAKKKVKKEKAAPRLKEEKATPAPISARTGALAMVPAPSSGPFPEFPRLPRQVVPKDEDEVKMFKDGYYLPLPPISKNELEKLRHDLGDLVRPFIYFYFYLEVFTVHCSTASYHLSSVHCQWRRGGV
jgi:hypothetical protein